MYVHKCKPERVITFDIGLKKKIGYIQGFISIQSNIINTATEMMRLNSNLAGFRFKFGLVL
jgi:hypothetical protein